MPERKDWIAGRLARTLLFAVCWVTGPLAAAIPTGFTNTLVASVAGPTSVRFTPDGRMLITTQTGSLRVFQEDALLPTPALTFPAEELCTNREQGLSSVAVDPAFAANGWIYLYRTFKKTDGTCVNRLSRFVLPASNVVDPATERILLDNIPSPFGTHNAGDLHFGKDGYLYVSVGDGGCDYAGDSGCAGINDAARDLHALLGKILRITADGGIPASNPFQGPGTVRCALIGKTSPGQICQETFAWGLRNPFRLAFDPDAENTRFFIGDVGQDAWEEIDEGRSGADYGWNCFEGSHPNSTRGKCSPTPTGTVFPLFEYQHNTPVPGTGSTKCNSVVGSAFVPRGLWPGYDGVLLFADYVCGTIFALTESGGTWSVGEFATGFLGIVHLEIGPYGDTQALYYTTFNNGGQVRRIARQSTGNDPPTAVMSASPDFGPVPLAVTFDGSGSSDPDPGDRLTWYWTFGDGTPETATSSPTIGHTYGSPGTYTARLRVRDSQLAFSSPVTVQIQADNSPPVPVITSPAATDEFAVGQGVVLSGSATDPQDGTLPASALSWTVLLHHNDHTHPFLGPVSGDGVAFTGPPPEDLAATEHSYLEIRLTATDSHGLSATTSRDFLPHKVDLTFDTVPAGLAVTANGTPLIGPQTVTSWEGYEIGVDAPGQTSGGEDWRFVSWSDGGAADHALVTPASPATYTATFETVPDGGGWSFYTLTPCRMVDTRRADGPLGGPALSSGGTRTFEPAGACGIPPTAAALAVNVTVVAPTQAGHFRIFPAGGAVPPTSVLNFGPGQVRANNAVLTVGSGGFSVLCGMAGDGSAQLLVDVVGYFE
jgi:glucose/arabinose dehydrogenase